MKMTETKKTPVSNIERKILKQVLLEWKQDSRLPLDVVLHSVFKEHGAGSRERSHVAEAAHWAVRYWATLFTDFDLKLSSPKSLRAIDESLEFLLTDPNIEKTLIKKHNQLKPSYEKDPSIHLQRAHALPATLMNSWNLQEAPLCEALHDYLHASLRPAPLCLRVNTLKIDREKVIKEFESFHARPSAFSPTAVILDRATSVSRHAFYEDGLIEIQDESSQILGDIMAPVEGMKILDYCAGAGGKTLHLATMLNGTGEVCAYDIDPKKLKVLKARADRAGLKNIRILTQAPFSKEKFDQVLMDVPCSSLGNLRRNPDRIQKIDSWKKLEIQSEIIFKCSEFVAPGGLFAYSTCTLRPSENVNKMVSLEEFLVGKQKFSPLSLESLLAKCEKNFNGQEFLDAANLSLGSKLVVPSISQKKPANMLQWSFSKSSTELSNPGEESRLSGAIEGDGFFVALYRR